MGVPQHEVAAFWRQWYHPERLAVAVVGDFPDGGEECIRLIQEAWAQSASRDDAPTPKPQTGSPMHEDLKVGEYTPSTVWWRYR